MAKETGFVKRERKIDPALMFWSLTLGFGVQLQRTVASLRRLYEEKGEVHISRSSFYDRFTPELVRFLHACVLHGLEDITQEPNRKLKYQIACGRFSRFQKSLSLCCPDSLIWTIETLLLFPLNRHQCFIGSKEHEKRARVHFIPNLKVGYS
jgi:hypothetical protein